MKKKYKIRKRKQNTQDAKEQNVQDISKKDVEKYSLDGFERVLIRTLNEINSKNPILALSENQQPDHSFKINLINIKSETIINKIFIACKINYKQNKKHIEFFNKVEPPLGLSLVLLGGPFFIIPSLSGILNFSIYSKSNINDKWKLEETMEFKNITLDWTIVDNCERIIKEIIELYFPEIYVP